MNYTIPELDSEFSEILSSMNKHHSDQRQYVSFYNNSAFYAPKPGTPKPKREFGVNLLKAFADKNINYTSTFPGIKVQPEGSDLEMRQRCSIREKVLYATHDANSSKEKQKKWAFDATCMSEAFAITEFDLNNRRVTINRLDPRYCYYQFANENDNQLIAFWFAYPMTADAIERQFGKRPTKSGLGSVGVTPDGNPVPLDSKERFWVCGRWDDEIRVWWAGDVYLEQPHKHEMGFIPVDRCAPLESGDITKKGAFFLSPLVAPQAEFNETLRRKANIIRKNGNPAVVGKGIIANQWDEVKKALSGEGGFIGLKGQGDISFLQLGDTNLFDQHLDRLFSTMKDIAGFPDATFGNIVGANTSGDALSMYFQPTTQAVANQWISWAAFYEGINEKILRLYEKFGNTGEQFELYGWLPKGTFETIMDENGEQANKHVSGGFAVSFTKDDIAGSYRSLVIVPNATPKDELAMKRLAMDGANSGFLPKTVAYELWDIVDPEETLDLLAKEAEDPRLHPETFSQVAGALNQGQQPPVDQGMPPMETANTMPGAIPGAMSEAGNVG